MIFKECYQSLYSQVQPEEKLLQATKNKMKLAASKSKEPKRALKFAVACLVATISFVALAKLLCSSPFVISMSNGPGAAIAASSAHSDSGNIIHVNELGELNKQPSMSNGLAISKEETWGVEKYVAYLTIDPRSAAIPQGLTFSGQDSRDMAYGGDTLLSMYNTWDFKYTADKNDAHAKEINIYTNKDFIPYDSAPRAYQPTAENEQTPGKSMEDQLKMGDKSTINGTEVTIWHKASGLGYKWGWDGGNYQFKDYYCADFKYQNVGFTVTVENGITQEELIALLSSIIKK